MKTDYVLVDYENVQPKDLALLNGHPFKVLVFVGANQGKIPIDFAEAMQERGANGCYVRIDGSGRNALDFYIVLRLGELTVKYPDSQFHIISKDTGFDPLIKHLTSKGLNVKRSSGLAEIPILGMSGVQTDDQRIDSIVKNLASRGQSRPRKRKTLASTINSAFLNKLDACDVDDLIGKLEKRGHIILHDGKVSYRL